MAFNKTFSNKKILNCTEITSELYTGITILNIENYILDLNLNVGITSSNLEAQDVLLGSSINNNKAYQDLFNTGLLTNLSISFTNERSYSDSRDDFLQSEIDAIITAGVSAGNVDILYGVSIFNNTYNIGILGTSSNVHDSKIQTLNNQVSGINYYQILDELEIYNLGITVGLHENDITTLYTLGVTADSRLDVLEFDVNSILLPGITFNIIGVTGEVDSTIEFLEQTKNIADTITQIHDYIDTGRDIYEAFQYAQGVLNTAQATYNGYTVLKDESQDTAIVAVQTETTTNSTAIAVIQGQIIAIDAFVITQLINNTSQGSSIDTNTANIATLGTSGIATDFRVSVVRTDLDNYISSNNAIVTSHGTTLANHTTSIFQLGSTLSNYISRIPLSTAGIQFNGQTIPSALMTDLGMTIYGNLSVSGNITSPTITTLGTSIANNSTQINNLGVTATSLGTTATNNTNNLTNALQKLNVSISGQIPVLSISGNRFNQSSLYSSVLDFTKEGNTQNFLNFINDNLLTKPQSTRLNYIGANLLDTYFVNYWGSHVFFNDPSGAPTERFRISSAGTINSGNLTVSGILQSPLTSLLGVSSSNNSNTINSIGTTTISYGTTIASNQTSISNLGTTTISYGTTIASNQTSINTHTSQIATLGTSSSNLDSRINTQRLQISALDDLTFSLSNSVSTLGISSSNLDSKVYTLGVSSTTLDGKVYQLGISSNVLDGKVYNLSVSSNNLDGRIANISTSSTNALSINGITLPNTYLYSSLTTLGTLPTATITNLFTDKIVITDGVGIFDTSARQRMTINNANIFQFANTHYFGNLTGTTYFQTIDSSGTLFNKDVSLELSSGVYKIAGNSVLSLNSLGVGVTDSSLTKLGTLSSLIVSGNAGVSGIFQSPLTSLMGVSISNLSSNKLETTATTLPSSFLSSSLTSVGTLSSLNTTNQIVSSKLAIGTTANPNFDLGYIKFMGTANTLNSPLNHDYRINSTISPVILQYLNYNNDNLFTFYNSYFNGTNFVQSDSSNTIVINKASGKYAIYTPANVGVNTVMSIGTACFTCVLNKVGINNFSPVYTFDVAGDSNISSGSVYRVNGNSVLSETGLGSGVINSSLTSLGTLSSGLNIASGQSYKINGNSVLTSSALGNSVLSSSLTSLGNLTSLNVSAGVTIAGSLNLSDFNTNGNVWSIQSYSSGTIRKKMVFDNANTIHNATIHSFNDTTNSAGFLDINSSGINLASGLTLKINSTNVISSTTLGSGVINSSLTKIGNYLNIGTSNTNPASLTFPISCYNSGYEFLNINSSNNNYLYIKDPLGNSTNIGMVGGDQYVCDTGTTQTVYLRTNGNNRLTISSAGLVSISQNLSVGSVVSLANTLKCSDYTENGSVWSIVAGSTNRKKLVFNTTETVMNASTHSFNNDDNSAALACLTSSGLLIGGAGANPSGSLYLATSVGYQATSPFWANFSDEKAKQNIKNNSIDKSISVFKKLVFKEYEYKDVQEKKNKDGLIIQRSEIRSDKTKIGCLAQDIELIDELKDCVGFDERTELKTMNYDLIFFHGLAVVQDLLKRIELLEGINSDLLDRINNVELKLEKKK